MSAAPDTLVLFGLSPGGQKIRPGDAEKEERLPFLFVCLYFAISRSLPLPLSAHPVCHRFPLQAMWSARAAESVPVPAEIVFLRLSTRRARMGIRGMCVPQEAAGRQTDRPISRAGYRPHAVRPGRDMQKCPRINILDSRNVDLRTFCAYPRALDILFLP